MNSRTATTSSASSRSIRTVLPWAPVAWDVLFVALPVIIALRVLLPGRETVLLFGDEFHSLHRIHQPYSALVQQYGSSGALLTMSQKFFADWLGPTPANVRLPSLLAGLGAIALMYPTAKAFAGRIPAALAALAFCTNPTVIFYADFCRSYSMALFCVLLAAFTLMKAIESPKPSPLRYGAFAVSLGLLPFAHLSGAIVGAGLGLGGLVAVVLSGAREHRRWLIGAGIAAVVLTALLYLPALGSARAFLAEKSGTSMDWAFDTRDVFGLLLGDHRLGLAALAGLPLGALLYLRERRSRGGVLILAVAAPVVGLVLFQPYGMVYAHARYLLTGLPFMLILLAWLIVELPSRLLARQHAGAAIGFGLGAMIVVLSAWNGPMLNTRAESGPFRNTYLSMASLPAFDAPWIDTSPIYEAIANNEGAESIVEIPPLMTRSLLLYRNYYLEHRKQVHVGLVDLAMETTLDGPYVDGTDPAAILASGADYAVLHRDPMQEVEAYWAWVYEEVWPEMDAPDQEAAMYRHKTFWNQPGPNAALEQSLLDGLGKPYYEDDLTMAWKLDRVDQFR